MVRIPHVLVSQELSVVIGCLSNDVSVFVSGLCNHILVVVSCILDGALVVSSGISNVVDHTLLLNANSSVDILIAKLFVLGQEDKNAPSKNHHQPHKETNSECLGWVFREEKQGANKDVEASSADTCHQKQEVPPDVC